MTGITSATAVPSERPAEGGDSRDEIKQPPNLRPSQAVQTMTHDKILMKQLLEVSRGILSAFLPDSGSPLTHHVSVRFWGAVDAVFRVSCYS